jgi:hypothetical protein
MKPITLPIAELKPALAGLGKVINPRSTLPVLHHVKIERTSDGWIALTGTDLDRFVTMRLEHPAEGPPILGSAMNFGASLNRPQRPKNCILTFDQNAEKQAKQVYGQSIYNNESLRLRICICFVHLIEVF